MAPATPNLAYMPEEILCKITANFGPTEYDLDRLMAHRTLPPASFLPLRQVCKTMDTHLFDRFVAYVKQILIHARPHRLDVSYSPRGLRSLHAILSFEPLRGHFQAVITSIVFLADKPAYLQLSNPPKGYHEDLKEYNDMIESNEDLKFVEYILGQLTSVKNLYVSTGVVKSQHKDALDKDFLDSFMPYKKILMRPEGPDVFDLPGLPLQRVQTAGMSRAAKAVMNGLAKSTISLQDLEIQGIGPVAKRKNTGTATLWSLDPPTPLVSAFAQLNSLTLQISDNELVAEPEKWQGSTPETKSPLLGLLNAAPCLSELTLTASSFSCFAPAILRRFLLEYTGPLLRFIGLYDWVSLSAVHMSTISLCKSGPGSAWQPILHDLQYELDLGELGLPSLFELERDTYDAVVFPLAENDVDDEGVNEDENGYALYIFNDARTLLWYESNESSAGGDERSLLKDRPSIAFNTVKARYGEPSMIHHHLPTKVAGFAEKFLGSQRPARFTHYSESWPFDDIKMGTRWEELWIGMDGHGDAY
ncbi:uncharacterized protein K452DRAFT_339482 [Aplosporella prunicola CBS 121167]|uniref:Uncharacterized protein n=1 Tax=Aplosporella prunicola CBS 121167 TaxID=1176127 RepID=A0A6A6B2L9_9PEZI|nr:uncharacterized protein K452DRAFT_339482 [Aplosporella prunicola CBS 121167]KAF2137838.1 hypothetical protein K452DRAFT_339482 [Aplosporella prunicola CBS 121167]